MEGFDLKGDRDTGAIRTDEVLFDGQTEQGVELDYVLPDYYPEIFKILKCGLTPRIIAYGVSADGKLSIDGVVYIKVLYLAEGSSAIHCVEQRFTYSKIVDIGRGRGDKSEPIITLTPRADYCNCRAVNSRRIDVRGAISVKIRAVSSVKYALPAIPEGLQVHRSSIRCCGETLCAEKLNTIREDIDTGAAGISYCMLSDAVPKITDVRIIADKAVLKGIVTVNALYGVRDPESSGCTVMEKMSADIPVSVILDMDGLSDRHLVSPELTVMNLELQPSADSGIISCELLVLCRVRAQLEETAVIPTDLYSTEYETDYTTTRLKICTDPRVVSQQLSLRSQVRCDSGEIGTVWDCRSVLSGVVCRPTTDSELMLSGQLCCQAVGKTTDGTPFFLEKQDAFEQKIPAADVNENTIIEFAAVPTDTGFSIKSDGTLDVTAQVDFSGTLRNIEQREAVSEVTIHEDKPKERGGDYALRIFYSGGGEDCWSVAKRYNTTVEAIMRENELEDENTPLPGMILIPTV